MKLGQTNHWDKIPDGHRCSSCFQDKHHTNFTVLERKGKLVPRVKCINCANNGLALTSRSDRVFIIGNKIDMYFREKYPDKFLEV